MVMSKDIFDRSVAVKVVRVGKRSSFFFFNGNTFLGFVLVDILIKVTFKVALIAEKKKKRRRDGWERSGKEKAKNKKTKKKKKKKKKEKRKKKPKSKNQIKNKNSF